MAKKSQLDTTFGDLVVALTDETQRHISDEKAAYEIVAYMLTDLLCDSDLSAAREL